MSLKRCVHVCVNTKQNMMDTTAQEEFHRCVRRHFLYLTRFSWLRAFTLSSPRMYFTSSTPFILYSSTMIDTEKHKLEVNSSTVKEIIHREIKHITKSFQTYMIFLSGTQKMTFQRIYFNFFHSITMNRD